MICRIRNDKRQNNTWMTTLAPNWKRAVCTCFPFFPFSFPTPEKFRVTGHPSPKPRAPKIQMTEVTTNKHNSYTFQVNCRPCSWTIIVVCVNCWNVGCWNDSKTRWIFISVGCSGKGVQWMGVVLYNKLVDNIIQITTPCFHCTHLWWILTRTWNSWNVGCWNDSKTRTRCMAQSVDSCLTANNITEYQYNKKKKYPYLAIRGIITYIQIAPFCPPAGPRELAEDRQGRAGLRELLLLLLLLLWHYEYYHYL